ncbi:unnamed protein product [Caenorhabditis angaria]|uniref:SH2 domain-containing protein n=1 Tax=Caenorhabditis angaria TaxID=860376 RepID=A0A9P1IJN0_9PELO|nr:unnamed protein product [Caenorhabditis angaria]
MTINNSRRRFSALIESLQKISNFMKAPCEPHYRSLSTGDLVANDEDFAEIQFKNTPTTSSLPAHFDDLDRVPMIFKEAKKSRLLSQHSEKAREMTRHGSVENFGIAKLREIHVAQTWFFMDLEPKKAERILMQNGFIEGSFLVSFFKNQYILTIWRGEFAQHLFIRTSFSKKTGEIQFQLDIDRKFSNLVELTDYYCNHKGYILQSKLTEGVSKIIRRSRA